MGRFLRESHVDAATATASLRQTFAAMFLAQVGMAALVAVVILLLGDAEGRPSVLGPVLAVLGLLQCGVGVFLPNAVARSGTKGAVLSATLLAGVLLATPGWFLMFALVTGQSALPLLALAVMVSGAYALGFVLATRYARKSVVAAREEPMRAE